MQPTIDTGVAWCTLDVTPQIIQLLAVIRERERSLPDLGSGACRFVVAEGVDRARGLADDQDIPDDDLAQRLLALSGAPWSQAPARRDMRERVRIWRRLGEGRADIPSSADELLDLWDAANCGEGALYAEAETARFRSRIPFAQGETPFDYAPPEPGYVTVAVCDIPREVGNLIAYLARGDVPAELHAATALFALWHIHPFPDGNGRVGRMLVCSMLATSYSTPTLLSFVRAMQDGRQIITDTMADIVREHSDMAPFVTLFLETLLEGQRLLSLP